MANGLAAITGALIGGLFTYYASIRQEREATKSRKKKLQRALIGEATLTRVDTAQTHANEISEHLRSSFRPEKNEDLDTEWLRYKLDLLENIVDVQLKDEVYKSNLGDLGYIESEQVEALLRYHHIIKDCHREINELRIKILHEELEGGSAEFIKSTLSQLEAEKDKLLEYLNEDDFEMDDGFANMDRVRDN